MSNSNSLYLHRAEVFLHAVANPLTTTLLELQLALQKSQEQQFSYIVPHLRSALDQTRYVADLFSQLQPGKKIGTPFNLISAITETIQLAKQRYTFIDSTISFHYNQIRQPQLAGSKILFQEAVLCLLANAVESYQPHQQKIILIQLHQTATELTLSVTDGGQGVDSGQVNQLFQEGHTLKESHTGIGLPFTKKLIEEMFGGKIELSSQKGRGTTARLVLPCERK